MDKKRKLTLIVFYLLMVVFALDLTKSFALMQKNIESTVFPPQPTVEEQIESMNTRLSQIEILEFRKNKMVTQEEEKIKNSKIMLKILRQDLEKLEKERTEIQKRKLVLKIKE